MPKPTDEERENTIQSVLKKQEYNRQRNQARKEEMSEQHRRWYQTNKEKLLKHREEHKEERAEYDRQHHLTHKEEKNEHDCQYRLAHREKMNEQARQHHQANREWILEQHRRYNQEHPEVSRQASRRRRALLAGSDGNFTEEEFRLLCEAHENRCVYCGLELRLIPDHAIPLSRGGNNSIENIVPSCTDCNNRKYTMTYDEYIESLKEEVKRQ